MARSYEDFLEALGHNAGNIITVKIALEKEIKSLSERLEVLKQGDHKLSEAMKN